MRYRFERLHPEAAHQITEKLNALLAEGWRVVSHAQDKNEYSFVLVQED